MQLYSDVQVHSISVITEKHENNRFRFHCPSRIGDGFVFVLAGNGTFTCGQEVFPLQRGGIMLVQKGDSYITAAGSEGLSYITTLFEMHPENAFRTLSLPVYMQTHNFPHIESNIRNLLAVWEERPSMYLMKARMMIEQLLIDLVEITNAPFGDTVLHERLTPAVSYITRHYSNPITNELLAGLCGLSVTHFRRLFREKCGMTPLQYRETIRMHWAVKLLESHMFSVAEIAEKLGYFDIYHFSKAVKKHTGFPPSYYRKNSEKTSL
jgi:AraC-like DNA-binding protein